MKTMIRGKGRSAGYAKDRMKLLLVSERIDCSPQTMKMLKKRYDTYSKEIYLY